MVCPEALGVRPPSLGAIEECRNGELMPMPLVPLVADLLTDPFAGDDWKKSGEDVGGFCDVS